MSKYCNKRVSDGTYITALVATASLKTKESWLRPEPSRDTATRRVCACEVLFVACAMMTTMRNQSASSYIAPFFSRDSVHALPMTRLISSSPLSYLRCRCRTRIRQQVAMVGEFGLGPGCMQHKDAKDVRGDACQQTASGKGCKRTDAHVFHHLHQAVSWIGSRVFVKLPVSEGIKSRQLMLGVMMCSKKKLLCVSRKNQWKPWHAWGTL
jgi:hypothetical protein